MPPKSLIHDADGRRAADDLQTWFDAAVARRNLLTAAMWRKNHSLLADEESVLMLTGDARFIGPRELEVVAGNDRLRVTAERVVINTGSVPPRLLIDGAVVGGRIHDSTTLEHVRPLTRRLVIVGAGFVGLKFASMFAHNGSSITVLDRGPRPLRRETRTSLRSQPRC